MVIYRQSVKSRQVVYGDTGWYLLMTRCQHDLLHFDDVLNDVSL